MPAPRILTTMIGCLVLGSAILGGAAPGGGALAASAFDHRVGRVHARPGEGGGPSRRDRLARTRCVGVDHVAGAVVFGDRAVELTMNDHSRWRMIFDNACPALSFYQGFYYRRAVAGRLCASRDAVMSRAGGSCPISAIVPVAR